MREKSKLETLLEKLHIDLYNYNEDCEFGIRSFEDVINDLAKSWGVLNDDYKDELYEAMGIVPSKPKSNLSYPVGVRDTPFKHPSDTTKKDTGIEYLQNQPTCKGMV